MRVVELEQLRLTIYVPEGPLDWAALACVPKLRKDHQVPLLASIGQAHRVRYWSCDFERHHDYQPSKACSCEEKCVRCGKTRKT